ncbi:cytochrome c biogenesis protein CcdA [Alphaproteobacteria bacterium]|nr:cytochrome c biogenesis protein CcdA [Alphaproteobacteria bacterium]
MFEVSFISAFVAGILSFLSPCVLPLVPAFLGYMGGYSLTALAGDQVSGKARVRVFIAALCFVLGFSIVFIALGLTVTTFGRFIADYLDAMRIIAGALIILMGLHFIGLLRLKFLMKTFSPDLKGEQGGFLGAFLMGLAFAFGWTPCVGPILASILMVAGSQTDSVGQGVALLAVYAAGIGIPFLLVSLLAGPFMAFMSNYGKHIWLVEKIVGVLLIITGILIITNGMGIVAEWLIDVLPNGGRIG